MPSVKILKQQIEESNSLKELSAALGEVATIKLRSIRDQVEKNYVFYTELSKVYKTVRSLSQQNPKLKAKIPPKNGKTLSVLLTSNYHLYGGLDFILTEFFLVNTVKFPTDRLVLGKVGNEVLSSMGYVHRFEGLVFKSDMPNMQEFTILIKKMLSYSRILVYYSKMITILNQEPAVSDLSYEEPLNIGETVQIGYILEPELENMLNFFENQILASLINSLFLESELSRTAARMISMDQAEENAKNLMDNQRKELIRAKHAIINKRILETYSGLFAKKGDF